MTTTPAPERHGDVDGDAADRRAASAGTAGDDAGAHAAVVPPPDARWYDALTAVGATTGDPDEAYQRLAAQHGLGVRRYHRFAHAVHVVDTVLALHDEGDDWAVAVLGAWFHDAVYDPRAAAGANEGASAVFAHQTLRDLGASATSIGSVARVICATADHRPAVGDRTAALLCDADLGVLAGDRAAYDRYVAAVRAEYAHLDDVTWCAGRRAVLRNLLDRPALFHTEHARRDWEGQARTNISRELAALR